MRAQIRGKAWIGVLATLMMFLVGCNDQGLTPQGSDFEDIYQQRQGDKVDVLWVIDNSGSMGDEQQALAQNFDSFINAFVALDLDFHLAVVTTDMENPAESGRFQGSPLVMKPDTPNLIPTFKAIVAVGTDGSGQEMGLEAARTALSEPLLSGHNAGFLRDDAFLAVIVVSDEDDGGSENNAPTQDPVDVFIDFFQTLKGAGAFSLGAIIGDVPGGCPDAAPGYRYDEAATGVGGLNESICGDFQPVLQNLGEFIGGLVTAFPLSYWPIEQTVFVRVDGVELVPSANTWHYLPGVNAIQFASDAIPAECVEVKVGYVVAEGQTVDEPFGEPGDGVCPAPPLNGDFDLEGGAINCHVAPAPQRPTSGAWVGLAVLGAALVIRRRRRG